MPAIVTLTMNPAIDVYTAVGKVEPTRKLRCAEPRRDPGGGGLNVARVAHRLGAEVVAVYPAGGLTGALLARLVDAEGLRGAVVPIDGETRQNFTVLEEATGGEYRFVLPGPQLAETEWRACLAALPGSGLRPDFVCASGSLPPAVPDDFYARVAKVVEAGGSRFALDTSGRALAQALEARVHLIKPNLGELRDLTGASLSDQEAMVSACRDLIRRKGVEMIALTLGAEGALLVTASVALRAGPLPVSRVSSVGAGDSFLGALAWALASEMSLEAALRHAVAAGSAALLAPGTQLCRTDDLRELLPAVMIESLPAPGRTRGRKQGRRPA